MSTIHQMYCTHCTHGSSALEQRDGELAQRTFGYSARAGSLEGEALRKCYQQMEPLLYYYLPRDTPDEQKLQLTAATAPRRFFYVPSAEGLQVCGQVCYRSTDSEGRPGSYFAHLIFQEESDSSVRWSPTELLRLCGTAGWVAQDSPEIAFKLEPLGALSDLLQGGSAGIDDAVLATFLRESGDSPTLADPAGMIPERWRAMEPQVRRDWFLGLLCTLVQSATSDRQPLALVAEPSLAALMFYGVLRLLPPGPLRDGAGFSTFESDPDRAGAFLSATWLFDAQSAARPEACPWQRATINTLLPPTGQKIAPVTKYAEAMVQRFLEFSDKGGDEIDNDLKAMATVRIAGAKDLDTLVEIDQAAQGLLERGTLAAAPWRNWPAGIEYLRQKLVERLAGVENLDPVLKGVVGGHAHLAVIDLLAGKPPLPGARHAVVHLLKELPPEKILGLLKLGGVSDEDKITVLLRHIHAHGTLPPGCEFLWEEWADAAEQPRRAGVVLMARVLAKLPAKAMEQFSAHVPQRCAHGFLLNCLKLVHKKKMKLPALSAMIRSAADESVFKLVREGGPQFLANYPKNEPALGEKMANLLRTLATHPTDFKERLDLILAGQHLLGEEVYHAAAASWDKCYKSIFDVGRLQRPDAGTSTEKRHALLVAACREMAMAADRAMTLETMDAEYTGSQKRAFLIKIGHRVLGGPPMVIPGAWETEILMQRVDSQLHNHRFSTDPLKKEAAEKKKKEEKKEAKKAAAAAVAEGKPLVKTSKGLLIATVVLLAVISVGVVYGLYYILTAPASPRAPKKGPRDRVRDRKKSSAAFDGREYRPGSLATTPLARFGRGAGGEGSIAAGSLTAAVVADIPALVHERVVQSG